MTNYIVSAGALVAWWFQAFQGLQHMMCVWSTVQILTQVRCCVYSIPRGFANMDVHVGEASTSGMLDVGWGA